MGEGLLKYAMGLWFRPPGPFTFAGAPDYQERLTGMTDWAPRKMVSRVSKGLLDKRTIDDIAKDERGRGLLRSLAMNGLIGSVGGGIMGRLAGGGRAGAPFANIARRGLSRKTLEGLKDVPRSAKALFAGAAGAGLLAGGAQWAAKSNQREDQARQIARGLLAERMLQRNALRGLVQSEQAYSQPLLQGLPSESASAQTPYAVTLSNSGL